MSNYLVDGFDLDTLRNIGQRNTGVNVSFEKLKASDINSKPLPKVQEAPQGFDENTLGDIGQRKVTGKVQFFETIRERPRVPNAADVEKAFDALKTIPDLAKRLFNGGKNT